MVGRVNSQYVTSSTEKEYEEEDYEEDRPAVHCCLLPSAGLPHEDVLVRGRVGWRGFVGRDFNDI